jgi:2'-5' RNA ligase
MLRLFVAIELPDDVRRALAATIARLRDATPAEAVRWVQPASLHITLKFLGGVEEARLPAIDDEMRHAAASVRPFDLAVSGLGSFGGRRSLRVIWAGIGGDRDGLATLAAAVEERLQPLGFPGEARPFAPHLTLGRVRERATPQERARTHDALAAIAPERSAAFHVASCSLMRSTLQRGGAVYDALRVYRLGEVA